MTPTDAVEEAIALLRSKRAALAAEVERIDVALAALTKGSESRAPKRPGEGRTAREMMVALAEEADRVWSVPEILAEYSRRGESFQSTDPDSALRAAIKPAIAKNQIYKVAPGRFRATKFREAEVASVNGHLAPYEGVNSS